MAAYFLVKVYAPQGTVANFNTIVKDSTNPQDGVIQVRNLMDSIMGGTLDAEVDVVVRGSDQTITAADGGSSANYNLK